MGERGDGRLLLSNRKIHHICLLARVLLPLSFLQQTAVFAKVPTLPTERRPKQMSPLLKP